MYTGQKTPIDDKRKRPERFLESYERKPEQDEQINQMSQNRQKQRSESYEARSEAAKKGWETRRKNQKKS